MHTLHMQHGTQVGILSEGVYSKQMQHAVVELPGQEVLDHWVYGGASENPAPLKYNWMTLHREGNCNSSCCC